MLRVKFCPNFAVSVDAGNRQGCHRHELKQAWTGAERVEGLILLTSDEGAHAGNRELNEAVFGGENDALFDESGALACQ